MNWLNHLILLPVVLPLLSGAALVLFNERHHHLKFLINFISTFIVLATACWLFHFTDTEGWPDGIGVYLAANWAAPFGIVLLADRLAALMLLLTAILATAALVYSYSRWSRLGIHFHSLFQFLLMGINGAFLTGDLFNLFVFFEVMLAASYGLVLHGYNVTRIRAGMQYIVVNLMSSFFFLIGIALIYAASGTLNMADLASRIAGLTDADRMLLETGIAILAVAFLTKSAMWPLGFWLPTTYTAACPPVTAMLVLMTKIGVYIILRLWLLLFSDAAGDSAGFGGNVLLFGGMLTLAFGAIGLLASQESGRMAGYSAVISSGTLLAAVGYGQPALISAALFYLLSSTLALAAFVLLIELIDRIRTPAASMLALTMEAFAIDDASKPESAGVAIPAAMAFLGLTFAACALIMAGLPPLSGFIAKFSIFATLLNENNQQLHSPFSWVLLILIIVSGLAAIIALMRFGVRTFWSTSAVPPRLQITEAAPISVLLALCVTMTIAAGPLHGYLQRVAADLHQPQLYIDRVISSPVTTIASGEYTQ
ncbi:monovalent cation/H+ antiporter subunit D [Chromatiaceae bacterium AAb-1]|nr:monovalent cation/H+ antiporter subunit D [Chromatiaceae bacterium AAb-1]